MLLVGFMIRPYSCYTINLETTGSLFSIAHRTEGCSVHDKCRNFSFCPTARNPADHSTTHKMCTKGSFLEGKLANHLRTCRVQVMNLSSYTSTPPYVFTVRCFKQKNTFDFNNSSLSPSVHSTFGQRNMSNATVNPLHLEQQP